MARLEGVGDVLQEHQAQSDVFVVAWLHVAAQLIRCLEKLSLEAEVAAIVAGLCHG
ncbi:hypothetical protein D9M68_981670 [compost metagenome]